MSNVDIFATGLAEKLLWWEEISLKAMTLDIADFLDNSYSISTFGGLGLTPSTSKRKLRSSQSSPLHHQRRRPIPHLDDADSHFEEEEEDEDEEVEQEGEGEEGTEEQGLEGLDEMATPTNRPSGDIPVRQEAQCYHGSQRHQRLPLHPRHHRKNGRETL